MSNKKGIQNNPTIFKPIAFKLVKAITVYIAKTCKYKTISTELMMFTIEVLSDMCEGEYLDRKQYRFQPTYIGDLEK